MVSVGTYGNPSNKKINKVLFPNHQYPWAIETSGFVRVAESWPRSIATFIWSSQIYAKIIKFLRKLNAPRWLQLRKCRASGLGNNIFIFWMCNGFYPSNCFIFQSLHDHSIVLFPKDDSWPEQEVCMTETLQAFQTLMAQSVESVSSNGRPAISWTKIIKCGTFPTFRATQFIIITLKFLKIAQY